ncbi:MAG: hypothetical protein J2P53_17110, partial [Bradyrhizobiaceae bacterium]|nr:hypothetical protein [Bradyrhizobiaceae bacterium]
ASGADALETALDELIQSVRVQRLNAALRVTARIARHALSRIRKSPRGRPGKAASGGPGKQRPNS